MIIQIMQVYYYSKHQLICYKFFKLYFNKCYYIYWLWNIFKRMNFQTEEWFEYDSNNWKLKLIQAFRNIVILMFCLFYLFIKQVGK